MTREEVKVVPQDNDNAMSNAVAMLMSKAQKANPIKPTDEQRADGMYYCTVCGEPRTKPVRFPWGEQTVYCSCRCDAALIEAKRRAERENERKMRVDELKSSSMMGNACESMTFESSEVRQEDAAAYALARRYVRKFEALRESGQGIVFCGNTGCGKTHIASCIANEIMWQYGFSVCMTSFPKLLAMPYDKREQAEQALNLCELAFIDDLGAERGTQYSAETVYRVINTLYEHKTPMLVTTNLSVKELANPTEMQNRRVYERILERCYPVSMCGASWRMDKVRSQYRDIQKMLTED